MTIPKGLAVDDRRPRANDALPKLLQKSHIPLKEQLQVIEPILQHRYAVHAHAEGEAGYFLGGGGVIHNEIEHVGIDHAAAENFDPSSLLARAARLFFRSGATLPASAADEAGDEHFGAGLCERKERWTEAGLYVRTKQRLHRMVERALQVAESDVRIHRQAFDLVEHGRVAGVGRVFTVNFAGNHNPQWRLHLLHGANLDGRSVGAKQ